MMALMFSLSFRAMGPYMLKIIASPMPSSARDSMVSTLLKSPLSPTYSIVSTLMIAVLLMNWPSIWTSCKIQAALTFRAEFSKRMIHP